MLAFKGSSPPLPGFRYIKLDSTCWVLIQLWYLSLILAKQKYQIMIKHNNAFPPKKCNVPPPKKHAVEK